MVTVNQGTVKAAILVVAVAVLAIIVLLRKAKGETIGSVFPQDRWIILSYGLALTLLVVAVLVLLLINN